MLAGQLGYGHELAAIALSLAFTYAIVFESGFDPLSTRGGGGSRELFQHPLTETVLAYVESLAVAFVILILFNQIEAGEPLASVLGQTLILGVPTAIGGAVGRVVM